MDFTSDAGSGIDEKAMCARPLSLCSRPRAVCRVSRDVMVIPDNSLK